MIKFVLVYALISNYSSDTSTTLTMYATKEFCETTRQTFKYPDSYKCIPHQEVVVLSK